LPAPATLASEQKRADDLNQTLTLGIIVLKLIVIPVFHRSVFAIIRQLSPDIFKTHLQCLFKYFGVLP
jgi:hypothetical protein